jgi:hypothetical protein
MMRRGCLLFVLVVLVSVLASPGARASEAFGPPFDVDIARYHCRFVGATCWDRIEVDPSTGAFRFAVGGGGVSEPCDQSPSSGCILTGAILNLTSPHVIPPGVMEMKYTATMAVDLAGRHLRSHEPAVSFAVAVPRPPSVRCSTDWHYNEAGDSGILLYIPRQIEITAFVRCHSFDGTRNVAAVEIPAGVASVRTQVSWTMGSSAGPNVPPPGEWPPWSYRTVGEERALLGVTGTTLEAEVSRRV